MKKRLLVCALIVSPLLCVVAEDEAEAPKPGGSSLARAFQSAVRIDENTLSMAGNKPDKRIATDEILAGLKDDDIFLKIDGDELKWKLLREHVDALDTEINRPDMQEAGVAAMRSSAHRARFRKLLRDYIYYGVFAYEARRKGLSVPAEAFEEQRAMARKRYAAMGVVGERLQKLMDQPESFYEHNLTNALLYLEYREKILTPKVVVEDDTAAKLVVVRHQKNQAVVATNEVKRVLIHDILKKLQGGMDFAEAARTWSECDSAEGGGVLMSDEDDDEPAEIEAGDLQPAVEKAYMKLKEGEISGVVETPYAWHIVKLLKRKPANEDDDETVQLAHIMLEKELLRPEFDLAGAREKIRKDTLRSASKAEFVELFKQTPIECKIPLMDDENGPGRRTKIIHEED